MSCLPFENALMDGHLCFSRILAGFRPSLSAVLEDLDGVAPNRRYLVPDRASGELLGFSTLGRTEHLV